MIKRILLALALLFAAPALADTWSVGQQATVLQPITNDVIGDGTTTQGGIAPAYIDGANPFEPADIADNFTTSTYLVAAVKRCTPVGGAAGSVNCGSAASEAKFRTLCNFGIVGHFDIIVSPGTANYGHLHMFWGNLSVTKDSNYSQLRQNGESTCGGNKINRSAYWAPALMEDLPSGVSAVRAFDQAVVYYTLNLSEAPKMTRIPRNFRYIGGYDPADPNNTKMTGPIATANTAAAWARYTVPNGFGNGTSSGTGFIGWTCLSTDLATPVNGSNANSPVAGNSVQPYLRTAAGLTTLTCPADGGLMAEFHAPPCWDGKNLGSNDGRHHVAYKVGDNNTGQTVCFDGWYQLPEFVTKLIWSLKGTEDVGKFYFSSDVMNYGAADGSARSPCRQVTSNYCRGETGHFDWFGAWGYGTAASPGVMLKWMNHCNGVKIIISGTTLNGDPAECDTSTIDSTNALQIAGTTSGGVPFGDPNVHYANAVGTTKWRLEPGLTGLNVIIQHDHTMNDNMPMPANDTQLAGVAPISFNLRKAGR
jgi:hypothetical protein